MGVISPTDSGVFPSRYEVTPGRLPEAEHGLAAGMEVG